MVSLPQDSRRGRDRRCGVLPACGSASLPPLRPRGGCPNASAGHKCHRSIWTQFFPARALPGILAGMEQQVTAPFRRVVLAKFSSSIAGRFKAIRLYASAAASVHASTLQKEATRGPSVPQRGWLQNLGEQRSLWAVQARCRPAAQKRSRDARRRALAPASSLRDASGMLHELGHERERSWSETPPAARRRARLTAPIQHRSSPKSNTQR